MSTKLSHFSIMVQKWNGEKVLECIALPVSGSDRQYYRLKTAENSIIAVFNEDVKENEAFFSFTSSFKTLQLHVPTVYVISDDRKSYLLSDLGDTTLFSHLTSARKGGEFSATIVELYKKVIEALPTIQLANNIDYSVCYPRPAFDNQSIKWDLSYFKYYFLKLAKIPFDEQLLENDFDTLATFLLQAETSFFLYRDFQSRNIMLVEDEVFFIDYQGGRKGALQYDIASLLWDAKAAIPNDVREELYQHYLTVLARHKTVDIAQFSRYYYAYVLIRILQALGAYGFRGFYEQKTHFLKSIPYALDNLEWLLSENKIALELPVLKPLILKMIEATHLRALGEQQKRLTIIVNSFSYKRAIPVDVSGNGGGFVFDCRGLPNPGREEQYKQLDGRDQPVIDYFAQRPVVTQFLESVQGVVSIAVSNYMERGFSDLMINFGCTGGQHRSVFCAERILAYLKEHFNVAVKLTHIERKLKEK